MGVLADADKAMYAAKELAHADGKSHVAYRGELGAEGASERLVPEAAD